MESNKQYAKVTEFDGVPKAGELLPLAFQHEVAMIIGCDATAIILAGVSGLSESDTVVLIQASLAMSAISTFIQLFPFIKFKSYQIGAGLPVIMGISFAYVPIMQSIAQDADVGTILGAQIVGGIVAIIVGIFIKQIRHLFPPLVTGTVVFAIGLSLYPTAVNYMAGGAGSADYGSWQNWLVAIITLVVVTGLNHFGKCFLKLSSVLIGIIVGYVVALGFGMVDFSSVKSYAGFNIPIPFKYGVSFDWGAVIGLGLVYLITAIEAYGDVTANSMISGQPFRGDSFMKRAQGGILADGFNSFVAGVFNSFPNSIFAQNNGMIQLTGVASRYVGYFIAGFLVLLGLFPAIGLIFSLMPDPVLGGATLLMFGTVAAAGMRIIASQRIDRKAILVIALSFSLCLSVELVPEILSQFPETLKNIFSSGITTGGLTAIIANTLIHIEEYQDNKDD